VGKKAKAKRAIERKRVKKSRKEAERQKYAGYKIAGTNTKSKRVKLANKRGNTVATKRHAQGRCYNHGCPTCEPELNNPAFASPNSCIYGKNWSSPKHR
jgi:hypothetical protein